MTSCLATGPTVSQAKPATTTHFHDGGFQGGQLLGMAGTWPHQLFHERLELRGPSHKVCLAVHLHATNTGQMNVTSRATKLGHFYSLFKHNEQGWILWAPKHNFSRQLQIQINYEACLKIALNKWNIWSKESNSKAGLPKLRMLNFYVHFMVWLNLPKTLSWLSSLIKW